MIIEMAGPAQEQVQSVAMRLFCKIFLRDGRVLPKPFRRLSRCNMRFQQGLCPRPFAFQLSYRRDIADALVGCLHKEGNQLRRRIFAKSQLRRLAWRSFTTSWPVNRYPGSAREKLRSSAAHLIVPRAVCQIDPFLNAMHPPPFS